MVYTKSGTVMESHSYTYDKNSNIKKEANTNTLNGTNEIREYTYDYMGQLAESVLKAVRTELVEVETGESDEDGNVTTTTQLITTETVVGTTSYVYDKVGNRTKKTEVDNSSGTAVTKVYNYTYNGLNQLKAETGSNGLTYTYDANGNLKSFNLLNVSDAFGTSRKSGSAESYYLFTEDLRGSTINVVDNAGGQVVSYWYDDFGSVIATKNAGYSDFVNEIQYTGAIYDEQTGLLYLNARFYDPRTGRFLTQDTYRGEKDNAGTWHLYAYCANNPINYVDPSGHIWETVLDVASIGWSAVQLATAPSWTNLGFLIWDIGATFIPFVPGSYTVKAVKGASKVSKISLKIPSTVGDLKSAKNLTVGTYKSLNKMFRGQKAGKIEIHHIIEKRFAKVIGKSQNKMASIAIDKKLHKAITRRFRKECPLGTNYAHLTRKQLRKIVERVYKDMPELKKIALEELS